MWTRLADWLVMSNSLPQKGRRAGVWAAWVGCLYVCVSVCNRVFIHVQARRAKTFFSLFPTRISELFHLTFSSPWKVLKRQSISEVTVTWTDPSLDVRVSDGGGETRKRWAQTRHKDFHSAAPRVPIGLSFNLHLSRFHFISSAVNQIWFFTPGKSKRTVP